MLRVIIAYTVYGFGCVGVQCVRSVGTHTVRTGETHARDVEINVNLIPSCSGLDER